MVRRDGLRVRCFTRNGNNISRYRRLLKTNLSDLERRFLDGA